MFANPTNVIVLTQAAQPAPEINPIVGLIPVAVPVGIAALKLLIPKINPAWLPVIAPLLGAAGDIALQYAGVSTLGPVWGALLGSAGVGVRELHDQLSKQITKPKQ